MQHWWQIHIKSLPDKVMQTNWKMSQHGSKMEIKNTWNNDVNNHHEKWCKNETPKAMGLKWTTSGPACREEVKSSPGDSRSRLPLASYQKSSHKRTSGKQLKSKTSGSNSHTLDLLAGTVRIYQYIGPSGPQVGEQRPPLWGLWSPWRYRTNNTFEANNLLSSTSVFERKIISSKQVTPNPD